jgi:hypothetical protein
MSDTHGAKMKASEFIRASNSASGKTSYEAIYLRGEADA